MYFIILFLDWSSGLGDQERVKRQLSVSSDSKLLDEDICEETRVILRPKKPPRPKSEVFLNQPNHKRNKRHSAFGVRILFFTFVCIYIYYNVCVVNCALQIKFFNPFPIVEIFFFCFEL